MSLARRFDEIFAATPLVAILRGVTPESSAGVDDALRAAGVGLVETPLNSPEPFETIRRYAARAGEHALVGAGTVLEAGDVDRVADAGGALIVAPNFSPAVVARARARGCVALPGVATPSEAFAALAAGAHALKLFPAEMIPPAAVKAMRAVLPRGTRLIVVGGVTPQSMRAYLEAGADGFGLGSALYRPGDAAQKVAAKAAGFVAAFRAARDASAPR